MGVSGLWKLIEPCGKPVPVETLEGKILAIDISIWLHQVVKGFQDSNGSALNNAHLLGLFNRLCKLLYYRVRPVFVFDGCVPQLKRETIARRQHRRNKLNNEAERIQSLILQSLAKEKVVQQALGSNADLLLKCGNKKNFTSARTDDEIGDLYKLPDLPSTGNSNSKRNKIIYEQQTNSCDENDSSSSQDEDLNPRHSYHNNLQAIDVRSKHFKNLPADVRHEILVDIKETRKQSSWGRLCELPSRSVDFSTFQMKRLLKRRAVQESLEEAQNEMGGRSLTFAELRNYFTEVGIVEEASVEKRMTKISSDENTRILLVRDLKNKLSKSEVDTDKEILSDEVKLNKSPPEMESDDTLTDLQMAIALSLQETQSCVEKDHDHDRGFVLKLNRDQKQQLKNSAVGPARSYMIEYGGMNDEDLSKVMDKVEAQKGQEKKLMYKHVFQDATDTKLFVDDTENLVLHVSDEDDTLSDLETVKNTNIDKPNSEELNLRVSEESDTDSDLEIVKHPTDEKKMEIYVDLKACVSPKDDLFADIFKNTEDVQKNQITKEVKKHDITHFIDNESEYIITETPTPIQGQSIFEKYRSEKKNITPKENNTRSKNKKMLSIFDDLRKQANDIKKINLNDIKLSNSVIELSDDGDDNVHTNQALKTDQEYNEIVEICDNEDKSLLNEESKSSNFTTPTKNKKIVEYFQKAYVVKRTPELRNYETTPEKIIKPYFKNKTPNEHAGRDRPSLKSIELHKNGGKSQPVFYAEKNEKSICKDIGVVKNVEDIIDEVAADLREHKSKEEIKSMADDLENKRRELEKERNRQDRMGMSISQRMNSECQELLRLFGIPYIIAPMEAEAQCAFLDEIELTNGTITEDSDIWLFGGRTVYKNFFANNKNVMEFRAERIEKSFNCDRNKLIQMACLVGSDYTPGIHGIGAVTALEILAAFSTNTKKSNACQNNETSSHIVVNQILSSLSKFRDWWTSNKATALPQGSSSRISLFKKLKNIELYEGFPSLAVVEAYLAPKVDSSKDGFTWGYPNVELIREFTRRSFGWTSSKTDNILTPVLKKINEKKTQSTIKNYFFIKSSRVQNQPKLSKRLKNAVERMSCNIREHDAAPSKKKRNKNEKVNPGDQLAIEEQTKSCAIIRKTQQRKRENSNTDAIADFFSNSIQPPEKTKNKITNSTQIIPQRVQDIHDMKAAEILNNIPVSTKKKRMS